MLYFYFRECERKKVIEVPNLPYFLTFSPLFYGMGLTMCNRKHYTNRSFKLACLFEGEGDTGGEVGLFTTKLAEGAFPYYKAGRDADRLAGWLIVRGESAPENPVAEDKARKHP